MKNSDGFTLIELLVVITIIGILASLAIPKYFNYLAKSQQVEARTNLSAIYVGMLAYTAPKELKGFEGATLKNIGFSTDGRSYYTYTLSIVMTNRFLGGAIGVSGQVVGDVWEIDQDREIKDTDPQSYHR